VRFISNRASGMLGFEVARAALAAGHRVILIHGPVADTLVRGLSRAPRRRLVRIPVRSTRDMHRAVLSALPRANVVVMAAAVADFTPARRASAKIKKTRAGLTLRLKPTVDILARLGRIKRRSRRDLVLIGFALETGTGRTAAARAQSRLREARRKLAEKNLDAIVLNTPQAMGAASSTFLILTGGAQPPQGLRGAKHRLASRLVKLGEGLAG
jgi:phosphopantothenoylcysteine decarboxylase/phosphopantothenate--cysteine ligase